MSIRLATAADIQTIKAIAVETDMFGPDEAGFVDETVTGTLDGSLGDHHWLVSDTADGTAIGAAYYAPEPFSDRLWNLYFIAVIPALQGAGIGGALIERVESDLQGTATYGRH